MLTDETICLVGCILLFLAFGSLQLWGNCSIYIISWLMENDSSLGGSLDIARGSIVVPIALLCQFAAALFSNRYCSYRAAAERWFSMLSIVGMSASVYLIALWPSFLWFTLCYCMASFFVGLNYMTPFRCGWRHFPHKRGRVTAWISAGYSFGPIIFNIIMTYVVNPLDRSPDYSVLHARWTERYFKAFIPSRVPKMFEVLAVFQFVLGIFGTFFMTASSKKDQDVANILMENDQLRQDVLLVPGEIQPNFEAVDLLQNGQSAQLTRTLALHSSLRIVAEGVSYKEEDLPDEKFQSLKDIIETTGFWKLFVIAIASSLYTSALVLFFKDLGLENNLTDHFLTYVGCLAYGFNGIVKGQWAYIIAQHGHRKIGLLLHFLCLGIGLTIPIEWLESNPLFYSLWVILSFILMGGIASWIVQVSVKLFGAKCGTLAATILSFAGIVSYILVGLFSLMVQNDFGYEWMLRLYTSAIVISIALLITIK